jgi:hypothetical protein
MTFTFDDMLKFATEAWGPLGSNAVDKWSEFNDRFFEGKLRPIPLVISNTQPFGKRLAFCSYGTARTITLNVPKNHRYLLADNSVLLHEMVHQVLVERGVDAAHSGHGWRQEIMRLHRVLTGEDIWAGRSVTARQKQEHGGKVISKVVRLNVANPDTGASSLRQGEIARWPHSCGICLGKLGGNTKLEVTQRRFGSDAEQITEAPSINPSQNPYRA